MTVQTIMIKPCVWKSANTCKICAQDAYASNKTKPCQPASIKCPACGLWAAEETGYGWLVCKACGYLCRLVDCEEEDVGQDT